MAGAAGASERGASMVNETYAGMGGAASDTYGAMQAFGGDSVTSALVRVCLPAGLAVFKPCSSHVAPHAHTRTYARARAGAHPHKSPSTHRCTRIRCPSRTAVVLHCHSVRTRAAPSFFKCKGETSPPSALCCVHGCGWPHATDWRPGFGLRSPFRSTRTPRLSHHTSTWRPLRATSATRQKTTHTTSATPRKILPPTTLLVPRRTTWATAAKPRRLTLATGTTAKMTKLTSKQQTEKKQKAVRRQRRA